VNRTVRGRAVQRSAVECATNQSASAVSVLLTVAQGRAVVGRAVVSRAVQHIRVRHYSVLLAAVSSAR
jgi:hypothetical protein